MAWRATAANRVHPGTLSKHGLGGPPPDHVIAVLNNDMATVTPSVALPATQNSLGKAREQLLNIALLNETSGNRLANEAFARFVRSVLLFGATWSPASTSFNPLTTQ